MRTAILIHGRHVDTDAWEKIIWGDPTHGVFGNAARGVELALKEQAALIFWGTGSSERNGVTESQLIFNHAIVHGNKLSVFRDKTETDIRAALEPISVIDLEAQNTSEEVAVAIDLCLERNIERLILVSAPTHIARCLNEALKVRAEKNLHTLEIFATASDVSYAGYGIDDVVVFEPPHRGDLPPWQVHRYVKAIFDIKKKGDDSFARFLEEFGELLKKWGIEVDWGPKG